MLRLLLHSPFLQHPRILSLDVTSLAAPLGPEEGRAYSAFKTANAFSISSKLTVPPTYAAHIPG